MPNCVPPLIANGNRENYLKAGFFSTLFNYNSTVGNFNETIFWFLKFTKCKNFGELFV